MFRTTIFVFIFFFFQTVASQHPFLSEVTELKNTYAQQRESNQQHIVFTGSSSIRIWKDLRQIFNNPYIVNTGFGGSQASDLLFFHQALILDYHPKKVFIYEGDNDLADGKSPSRILRTIKKIIKKIKGANSESTIVLIAAKPSIARWDLKEQYIKLNKKYSNLSKRKSYVHFADVWTIMLENNVLKKGLFLKDGLHMNKSGYLLWEGVIKEFL